MNQKYETHIGKKYNRLKIIEMGEPTIHNYGWNGNPKKYKTFKCICDCGKVVIKDANRVVRGLYKSCGCLLKEMQDSFNDRHVKTGRKSSRWKGSGDVPKQVWNNIYHSALRREIPFEITIEEIANQFVVQNKKCAISGELLTFGKQIKRNGMSPAEYFALTNTASLDRIDSTKGYVKGNIQWVHKDINKMKQNLTENLFFEWIEKIYNHRNNR